MRTQCTQINCNLRGLPAGSNIVTVTISTRVDGRFFGSLVSLDLDAQTKFFPIICAYVQCVCLSIHVLFNIIIFVYVLVYMYLFVCIFILLFVCLFIYL